MKEIFYSNGVDIFGPVSLREFAENRYYKSTLIWFEGLPGWVNISECEDLKHLIGTMPTPSVDLGIPHSLPNLTPPLNQTQRVKAKTANRSYMAIAVACIIVLLALGTYYFNRGVVPAEKDVVMLYEDSLNDKQPTLDSAATREVEIVKKAALEAEKKTYRIHWDRFITALPNDYKQKEIGGINDLKISVKNNSPYKIDQVVVKVAYVKANGSIYQTEVLTFDNVDANGSKELFAPESDRGVKVNCTVLAVKSTAMNLCLDKREKDFAGKKGEDPYLCQ